MVLVSVVKVFYGFELSAKPRPNQAALVPTMVTETDGFAKIRRRSSSLAIFPAKKFNS
jgi:hypothetical protein